jgi:hypothetical protein
MPPCIASRAVELLPPHPHDQQRGVRPMKGRTNQWIDTFSPFCFLSFVGHFASNFADGFGEFGFWYVYWNQLTKFDGYDSTCQ